MNKLNLHVADKLIESMIKGQILSFNEIRKYILGERLERHYDPCPKCKGEKKSQCQYCYGRGWVRG